MEKEKAMNKKQNCLTLIRYIAALNVFWFHAVAHLDVKMPEPLNLLMKCVQGVPVFFVISGFLIWMSLDNTLSFSTYMKKRVLRLYPELWGGVFLNTVVILFLYRENIVWKEFCLFQVGQATIVQFWTPLTLRGYGCGTPNGVLASICVLLQAYVVLFFLHKWYKNKKWQHWLVLFIGSVVAAALFERLEGYIPTIAFKLIRETALPSLWMFILGAAVQEFFDKVMPKLMRIWPFLFGVSLVFQFTGIPDIDVKYSLLKCIFLGLSVLGFAYAYPRIRIKHDISYGLFIYHMIVINAMIELGYSGKQIYVWIALVISFLLAYFSYCTLGSLSHKIKSRL